MNSSYKTVFYFTLSQITTKPDDVGGVHVTIGILVIFTNLSTKRVFKNPSVSDLSTCAVPLKDGETWVPDLDWGIDSHFILRRQP